VADDDGVAAVIDPGFDPAQIDAFIQRRGWRVAAILLTHGHFDHVAGNRAAAELWQAPLYLHPLDSELATHAAEHAGWFGLTCEDSPPPDHELTHGQTLEVGGLSLEVRHTPGHSPGSVTFVLPGHAFVGDVLFEGSIGRYDLPGADFDTLMASIREQLMNLPDDTLVHPGHGDTTTVGSERMANPFRGEWEVPA
jgi:glyoxylase-like metal-dependent hydrolase (beta-lactamase superfamily II)